MKPAIISLCLFLSLLHCLRAQSCVSETFSSNRVYSSCNSLPYLGASLHWNYHSSNGTVDVAYRAPESSSGWIAWAVNPTGSGMIGANAFLAFPGSNGAVTLYTTKFSSYTVEASGVKNENLSFPVYSKQAEYENGYYTIFAALELPNNSTKLNTVWQASTQFQNGVPNGHPSGDNLLSKTNLDFLSGEAVSAGGNSRLRRKNIHGVLNSISWGILMPIGAIMARYVKVFKAADPAWFYLHVACQCSAYIIGISGWGLGLKLGSESVGITYHKHRDIAIALFCLATVQVFALLLRPNKEHKYRIYWNVYHHSVGYCIIILSIVNIFEGFDILDPAKKWKHAYIGVIATLGGVALVLEAVTWPIVLRRRSRSSEKSHHGVNGANGYGVRQHQVV
ncbi:hypothetical protein OPV22_016327 [Ensete ventricosum]|uniref:Cytochrome b561 and DOMON domain-containing protein n=1 Tax=Ensete ventricosum TaxID=4639 RepID=A0AAV8QPN5_ENSVE|nr:hypothetical protein OPV22_016327 [Ensete ventricosum]